MEELKWNMINIINNENLGQISHKTSKTYLKWKYL